jgi:hypothetical protein
VPLGHGSGPLVSLARSESAGGDTALSEVAE